MKYQKNIILVAVLIVSIFSLIGCRVMNNYYYSNDSKQPKIIYLTNHPDSLKKYQHLKPFNVKDGKELVELIEKLKKNRRVVGIVIKSDEEKQDK